MKSIRCGKGFGDALYLQSVARHFVLKGKKLEICSAWPDVFEPLGDSVKISPFRRTSIDILAHYTRRKNIIGTDMFQDCCIEAGITEPVEMKLDWTLKNRSLVENVRQKAADRLIVLVQMVRAPMGRADGYGLEILPDYQVLQKAVDALVRRDVFTVQIGSGQPLYEFSGLGMDLANKTTVSDVIDLASTSDAALGYCSFLLPLAESLEKPLLLVWSRRGLMSRDKFINTIVPNKMLHSKTSSAVVDDCSDQELIDAIDQLFEKVRSPVAV